MPRRNAKKFVARCIGGVKIRTIKILGRSGNAVIINEKRRAPTTKSSWSAIGKEDPGAKPSRRLMKESDKSPAKAPNDSINPRDASYRKRTL